MAVSVDKIATDLRLTAGTPAPAPIRESLARSLALATALVDKRAPDAPEAVADIAKTALVGYLYDRPFAGAGERYANAYRNSGAAAMLAPWHTLRAVAIDDNEEATPMLLLDRELTTESPVSEVFTVREERRVSLQALADAAFGLGLEGTFQDDNTGWGTVLTMNEAVLKQGDSRTVLNPLVRYRVRLSSGGPVRVLIG